MWSLAEILVRRRGSALNGGIAWELDSAKSSRLPLSHPAKLPSAGIRIAATLADWKRDVWNDLPENSGGSKDKK